MYGALQSTDPRLARLSIETRTLRSITSLSVSFQCTTMAMPGALKRAVLTCMAHGACPSPSPAMQVSHLTQHARLPPRTYPRTQVHRLWSGGVAQRRRNPPRMHATHLAHPCSEAHHSPCASRVMSHLCLIRSHSPADTGATPPTLPTPLCVLTRGPQRLTCGGRGRRRP